jgi:hypothetical protein
LTIALCVCLLLTVVTRAYAPPTPPSPELQQFEQKSARWFFGLFEKHLELPKEIPEWPKNLQVTRDQAFLIWSLITVLLGAATAKGIADEVGRSKENSTLAIPDSIRSIESDIEEPHGGDAADVAVFAPQMARPRENLVVQVIVVTRDRDRVLEATSRAAKLEPRGETLNARPLRVPIGLNDAIKITVDCEGVKIAEPTKIDYWNGIYVNLEFIMELPDTESDLVLTPNVHVAVNQKPAAELLFRIVVSPNAPDLAASFVDQKGYAYHKPFVSYAREDQDRVLEAAKILKPFNI